MVLHILVCVLAEIESKELSLIIYKSYAIPKQLVTCVSLFKFEKLSSDEDNDAGGATRQDKTSPKASTSGPIKRVRRNESSAKKKIVKELEASIDMKLVDRVDKVIKN